jgi:hypothetical protein
MGKLRVVKAVESKREREDREADEENAAKAEVVRVCRRMSGRARLEYLASIVDDLARMR